MKNVLIGTLIGLGIVTGIAIMKINDDRQVETLVKDGEATVIRKETFKKAAKRKVNEILRWIGENPEKVEGIVKVSTAIATSLSIITACVELYSSVKKAIDKSDEKLLNEVEEIRMRLVYLSPDLDITAF